MRIFKVSWLALLGLLPVLPCLSRGMPDTPPPAREERIVTGAHRPCVAFRTCESLMHGIDGVEIAALVGPIVCPKPMVRRVPAAYPLGVYSFPFSAGRLNLHYVKPRFLPICVLHRPRLISAAARPTCSYVEFGRQCASYAHDMRAALVGARPTSSQVKTFFFFFSLSSPNHIGFCRLAPLDPILHYY